MDTRFETLAHLGEQLEKTSGRLQMTEMIAQFLRELPADEVPSGVRLLVGSCLLYTSPSPRDRQRSRMPSSA